MRLNSKIYKNLSLLLIALGLMASAEAVRADVPLDGTFVAGEKCLAFQSLRKKSKRVSLKAGQAYKIIAANKASASHYLIIVPGASPERRWAPIGCGTRTGAAASDGGGKGSAPKADDQASSGAVGADVPLKDTFVAGQKCLAFQSLRKKSKPARLKAGKAYKIIAANKAPASHYLIIVPGASPERRWAPINCGTRTGSAASDGGGEGSAPKADEQDASGAKSTQYVLAASWQPGFCETKPGKVECQSQTADRYDASHFSLHGLWPQPRSRSYCKVAVTLVEGDKAGRWYQLPEITLQAATGEELKKVMPGTQSLLDRHEWIKHGTCYGTSAEEYFADALGVMRALNGSAVRQLFASHVGKFLSFDDIRKAFDASFGAGAGDRVRMQCERDNGRLIIAELTIGLTGDITPQSSLSDLLAAAAPTKTECPGGIVDAVGQQ